MTKKVQKSREKSSCRLHQAIRVLEIEQLRARWQLNTKVNNQRKQMWMEEKAENTAEKEGKQKEGTPLVSARR